MPNFKTTNDKISERHAERREASPEVQEKEDFDQKREYLFGKSTV
jgi:hypothetical protein